VDFGRERIYDNSTLEKKRSNLPVVVVAGQVPPPVGGQNVMVAKIFDEISSNDEFRVFHLPFYFTPTFESVRRFRFSKLWELFLVCWRFLKIRLACGRVDFLLYPAGGPQTVPMIRDLLLLPVLLSGSVRVVVQFHAAGIEERLSGSESLFGKLFKCVHRRVTAAVVMTEFNRRDPEALGVERVFTIPHRLVDENPERRLPDHSGGSEKLTVLYAGHLYDQKGTPELIEAFARVAAGKPGLRCVLMGEFLPPYSWSACETRCQELGIADRVEWVGVQSGAEKSRIFSDSGVFVFPSVAPYESFGLVMVEAMMWGLPIVATDWRGNRDVAGPVAEYCETGSRMVESLAAAIECLVSSPAKLMESSLASRERFEMCFCENAGAKPYVDLVREVLQIDNGKK
jgi:glycosyltransferase involved in cell wall biosynthesis